VTVSPHLGYDSVEIVHAHGEVLAHVRRCLSLDEMELLITDVEPSTPKPKVRSIIASEQPEGAFVERQRLVEIADVDGDVMDGEGFHDGILADWEVWPSVPNSKPPGGAPDPWCTERVDLGTISRRADVAQR
jgi:hypothetical protein